MAKARLDNAGRKYGVARARRFAARLREKHTRRKRLRRIEKASRQFNLMRASGKR